MGLTVTGWAASSLPLARLPRAVCRAWVLAFSLAWLGGCAVAPSHSGLQPVSALPPLLPVRSFVADLDASGAFQISPDGKLLMWSARIGLGPGLFVKDLASLPCAASASGHGTAGTC